MQNICLMNVLPTQEITLMLPTTRPMYRINLEGRILNETMIDYFVCYMTLIKLQICTYYHVRRRRYNKL